MRPETLQQMMASLREAFLSGRTRPYPWRRAQLVALRRFLVEGESEIAQAIFADLGKPEAETHVMENSWLQGEISYVLRHLRSWMRPVRVSVPLVYFPATASWSFQPHGVVLVLGAWNYPLQLCLAPLVGALAAGNCAVLKPSEQAPATSALLADRLPSYLDSDAVRVVEGGRDVGAALLEAAFDYLFYTGSRRGGREVMEAAARRLVPLTLEMGGKSPCIVERGAPLPLAARRIVWAKFLNAGQTCIAPDYVLVHEDLEGPLLDELQMAVEAFYGPDPCALGFGRIVNARQQERLRLLMGIGGCGGEMRAGDCSPCMPPTIVGHADFDSPLMRSEIFGPILPVIAYRDLDEALEKVAALDDPLALYLFSPDRKVQERVVAGSRSGGICINDLMFQAAIPSLPFGGVGRSGFGTYHGKAGFESFSVKRSLVRRTTRFDPWLRYPPYGKVRYALLRWVFGLFS